MAKYICEIEGCGEEISENTGKHGGLAICTKCSHVRYYWRKRGTGAVEEYKRRLEFRTARMEYLSPHVKRQLNQAARQVNRAKERAQAAAQR